MNIDVPDIINSMVPESRGRSARVISDHTLNYRDHNFLSSDFPRSPPKIYLTAEDDEFDDVAIKEWRDEGFDVEYLPMGDNSTTYIRKLRELSNVERGPCETFGIVAYGDAATLCLQHYHILDNNPGFKLGLLIAYYPTSIPDTEGRFPSSISVLVHLIAGEEIGVTKRTQMVGFKSKSRTIKKKIEDGLGIGGLLQYAYPSYAYKAQPGFAEHDLNEYDRVAADMAWTRNLSFARQAFNHHVDLELPREQDLQGRFFSRNLKSSLESYTDCRSPHVTFIPTLTGAINASDLERFYSDFFGNPPSLQLTLLSRTIGAGRIVDEIHVRFRHTQEMQWILPGIPPTHKRVQVVVVSVVTMKGEKISHEHVYWDQASVLVQTGLLDPGMVSEIGQKLGIDRLPVVGTENASRVLHGWKTDVEGEADNALIPDWDDGQDEAGSRSRDAKGKENACLK